MTKKVAGLNQVEKGKSKQSYSLYDTCDKCPMWVYIDLVCNDNVKSLIIEGRAPDEMLIECKHNLITEFAELSGNTHAKQMSNIVRNIYLYKSQIQGLTIAINLLVNGEFEAPIEYLNKSGLKFKIPETNKDIETIIKRVEGHIKDKIRRINNLMKDYDKLTEGSTKVTPQFYTEQLATLSKHFGFRIDKNITLSEYAAYVKDLNEYIKHIEYGKLSNK